jgi:hypothetical protein
MHNTPKLTTVAACRVAGIHRDRFNEHVAARHYRGAPSTIPGRARLFDPADMIGLCLFQKLINDGFDASHAGRIACAVGLEARLHPESSAIAYVDFDMGSAIAAPADDVPAPADWSTARFADRVVRKVTIFNVGEMRKRIAEGTEYERSVIGDAD